jgi:hypothetical protein
MLFATNNDYNEYFITTYTDNNVDCALITYNAQIYNSLKEGSTFKDFLKNYNLFDLADMYGKVDIIGNHNGGEEETEYGYGYVMPDGWKHQIIDDLVADMDVDEIDTFIGEIGIRKAFKIADDSGIYEDDTRAFLTDDGIKKLFFAILYSIIELADGVEQCEDRDEYEQEIESEEWVERSAQFSITTH